MQNTHPDRERRQAHCHPSEGKEFLWPQRLTWIPSSSLLMHQKLSASMLRKTSCDRFVTSKFSTSSSAKQRGKSIRELGDIRDTGQSQGLCHAKALLQHYLCVGGVPGTVTAPLHSPISPAELKNPKRLVGHALNPVQLPREPQEGSHSTSAILQGQGLCRDKGLAHWNPFSHSTPALGDSRSLPAGSTPGRTGRGETSSAARNQGRKHCPRLGAAQGSCQLLLPAGFTASTQDQSTAETPSPEAASFEGS